MSPKKSRKPLDDALAKRFIYGEKSQGEEPEAAEEQTPSKLPTEQPSPEKRLSARTPQDVGASFAARKKIPHSSIRMDQFQTPPKEATVRLTVDLPTSMHRKLSILAARTGKKKAEIVRVLLLDVLEDLKE
ncbi:MAG TPA: hypothetical protein VLA84_07275 [Microcoleus sp.]|nr:hypothetical protein [Microcoleus sp.]